MTRTTRLVRPLLVTLVSAALAAAAAPASAIELELFDTEVRIDNLFTVGALFRTQERNDDLIAKANLDPGLCVDRVGRGTTSPDRDPDHTTSSNDFTGDTCVTSILAANERYVAAKGSYAINGDNGNLNFGRGDIVHAAAKLTSDFSFSVQDYNVFFRTLWVFDDAYIDMEEYHPDLTLQHARHTNWSGKGRARLGTNFEVLDYYVSHIFDVGDREVSVKLGNQVLNWGESAFLIPNSLNTLSPPNQALLRVPGFDVKELFQPIGMLLIGTEVMESVNAEFFYQYDHKTVVPDPAGSFFSTADLAGDGGNYAMLSFGKAPEDPGVPTDQPDRYVAGREGLYSAYQNSGDALQTLGSESSRTIFRNFEEEEKRAPDDGGQYGLAVKWFLEDFNNGTELGFYYANYHSRLPLISTIAAQDGCWPDPAMFGTPLETLGALAASCGLAPRPDSPGDFSAASEPLPVDTASYFIEYPEDIKLYGVSFNTTVGDWAWSGEYAYRPNLPVQVDAVDLVLTTVSPAFPEEDLTIGASVVPGERSATAAFLPLYRNYVNEDGIEGLVEAGQYVRGYERLKVGQLETTFLKTVGGDNLLGASQIVVLMELGMTNVFDMPALGDLPLQGAGVQTHISHGADGTRGVQPKDQDDPDEPNSEPDDGQTCASAATPKLTPDMANPRCKRQNPTAQPLDNLPDDISYGYRFVFLPRYDSAVFGANLEFLTAMFHDVGGTTPGVGTNFVEGRKQILFGVRFDYLSKWVGEVRYTWFTGANNGKTPRDTATDRDNLLFWVGYQF